jgi:DNA-directed RNA polymerase II subunit RPB1
MSFYPELEYNGDIEKVIGVQFSIMSPEEIRRRSVVEVTKPETFSGNVPVNNGLFDIHMGVLDNGKFCKTDGLNNRFCPGYFGSIELAMPVFYIHFMNYIIKTLENICYRCGSILLTDEDKEEITRTLAKKKGYKRYIEANRIITEKKNSKKGKKKENTCHKCNRLQPDKYKKEELAKIVAYWGADAGEGQSTLQMTPEYVLILFKRLNDADCELLGFHPKYSRPEWMICQVLPVCPPAVRPSVKLDNSQRMEDDLTHKLFDIIKINNGIKKKVEKDTDLKTLDMHRNTLLQYHVSTLIDNEIPNINPATQRTGRPLKSIRQRLKGKEGRIRGNLMGKRVDFSARTVITPDPLIKIDQLGVPYEMCKNLTYPEIVTVFNIERLREMVLRGPEEYPGAKSIKKGQKFISLKHVDRSKKAQELNLGDVVNRHLIEGDVVLFNRQPSLHKMSMMAHKVRPTPSRTFRLAVDVTTPYNADFDGDEMNMHVPQSLESRNELECLASVYNQLISPALNKPIIYVVQDTCLGLYLMTRDTEDAFSRRELMNSLMYCNNYKLPSGKGNIVSGHEALNTILPDINMITTNPFYDGKEGDQNKNLIKIKRGKFESNGIIEKSVFNKSSKGLVHVSFNDAGALQTRDMIDNIRFLITNYLLKKGFSVGMSDLVMDEKVHASIRENINKNKSEVVDKIKQVHSNTFVNKSNRNNSDELENILTKTLNSAANTSGSLVRKNIASTKENRFVDMVNAGSKGSELNISQMFACIGQVTVDGKRISYGFSDRTLPHFSKYDDSSEARGFVENSFTKGLTPQEFFFHAMGGREGLIDTAVKTSDTGYIQRKLVKTLEDLKVFYDGTVRDANNNIVQFQYGEDGYDACKIEEIPLQFVTQNNYELMKEYLFENEEYFELFMTEAAINEMKETSYKELVEEHFKKDILGMKKYYIENMCMRIPELLKTPTVYFPINYERCLLNTKTLFNIDTCCLSDLTPEYVLTQLQSFYKEVLKVHDSILLKMLTYAYLSPKLLIKKHRLSKVAFDYLLNTMKAIYFMAKVQAGEMVGAIAAQSIGEPATQMTLNTFHFAGIGEKTNVTRGVPRIKELFNITKAPKNPSLTIYPKNVYKASNAEQNKTSAKDLMDVLEVTLLGHIVTRTNIFYRFNSNSPHLGSFEYIRNLHNMVTGNDSLPEHKWVMTLELNKTAMVEKSISIEEVTRAIKKDCGGYFNVYATNEGMPIPYIYITFDNIKDGDLFDKLMKTSNYTDESDKLNVLKVLEKYLLEKVTLRGIPELKRISLFQTKVDGYYNESCNFITPDCWVLDSLGSNLLDTLIYPGVDAENTISNNIYQIYETLGIEAARNALVKEINGVIRQENSYVNIRHIGLLADAMTSRGILMSVDRHGVNRGDIGPLAKCSFEETDQMLYRAAVFGEFDNVKGVSSNIMLGQVPPCGTGFTDIMLDEDKYREIYEDKDWVDYVENYSRVINKYNAVRKLEMPTIQEETDECSAENLEFSFNPDL